MTLDTSTIKPTSIDGIKSLAKEIKKAEGVSHCQALEIAARRAGYGSYAAARRSLGATA